MRPVSAADVDAGAGTSLATNKAIRPTALVRSCLIDGCTPSPPLGVCFLPLSTRGVQIAGRSEKQDTNRGTKRRERDRTDKETRVPRAMPLAEVRVDRSAIADPNMQVCRTSTAQHLAPTHIDHMNRSWRAFSGGIGPAADADVHVPTQNLRKQSARQGKAHEDMKENFDACREIVMGMRFRPTNACMLCVQQCCTAASGIRCLASLAAPPLSGVIS